MCLHNIFKHAADINLLEEVDVVDDVLKKVVNWPAMSGLCFQYLARPMRSIKCTQVRPSVIMTPYSSRKTLVSFVRSFHQQKLVE